MFSALESDSVESPMVGEQGELHRNRCVMGKNFSKNIGLSDKAPNLTGKKFQCLPSLLMLKRITDVLRCIIDVKSGLED